MMMKLFVTAAAIVLVATTSVALASSNQCATACSADVCNNKPVCGFSVPFRCSASNGTILGCFAAWNANNCTTLGGQCCDARACSANKPASKCSSAVCAAQPCGAKDWVCTSGFAKNGCGTTAHAWENNTACGAFCDMSTCSSAPTNAPAGPTNPPSPTGSIPPAFTCGSCTKKQCDAQFRCYYSEPYQCTAGKSAGGCAKNASTWTKQGRDTDLCTACCDVRTCDTKCEPCPKSQCYAPVCPPTLKYTCTAGADKNGCAPSAAYWSKNPGCDSCCFC